MLDKFLLKVDAVEKHRCDRDDDHFLVHGVYLRQRLQNLGYDVIALDFFLRLYVHAKVGDCGDDVAKDFLFAVVIQHVKEDLEEAFLEQVR